MNVPAGTLVIRADASATAGTGHVMRCLALAQAWQDMGGEACFVSAPGNGTILSRLESEDCRVETMDFRPGTIDDAKQTMAAAGRHQAAWLVVDGYHFGASYLAMLKLEGMRLLVVDDKGFSTPVQAHLILNQNLYADPGMYQQGSCPAELLLGPRYALLRREFRTRRDRTRSISAAGRRILVTLGGSDPANASLTILRSLEKLSPSTIEATVVVGGGNPNLASLQEAASSVAARVNIVHDVSDMTTLMAWADVAVAAAGTTCWELAFMGLPALVLSLAENQKPVAEAVERDGIARNLGWYEDVGTADVARELAALLVNREARFEMSRKGQERVDGLGSTRVVAHLRPNAPLRARPAALDDIKILFDWANDPMTRLNSFSQEPIPWQMHRDWFSRVLHDTEVTLLIVEMHELGRWRPIGQVRIDPEGTVSMSLDPAYRRRGLGHPVLSTALTYYRLGRAPRALTAFIKPDNIPSQRIFERGDFHNVGPAEVAGQACDKYVWQPEEQQSNDTL